MSTNGKRDKEEEPIAAGSPVVARLQKTTVFLLENVANEASATDIRRKAHKGQSIHGLVPARVEEYILKQGLYR
jgi:nicotinic acid mononucleotide adenylyltransferase